MREHAINSDIGVLGVIYPFNDNPSSVFTRGPENAIIDKELNEEKDSGASREKHELCAQHTLPKGITCPVRFENKGLYFCRIKDDCPLKLV